MIAAYSPQARGRSERAFGTHQGRLPRELALYGITTMESANRYLAEVYRPAHNTEFMQPATEEGSAFVPWVVANLEDILCEHHQRTVTADNCVSFGGKTLQIPVNRHRCHYVRVRVRVHKYMDGSLAIFHGPRKLADYDAQGKLKQSKKGKAAHVRRSSLPLRKAAPGYDFRSFPEQYKADNLFAIKPDSSIC